MPKKCIHGKSKYRCKECGTGICIHGKSKYCCKECGGSGICVHGKVKYVCKECKGSSICAHGRVKYVCKECGGSGICAHGRVKYVCKECGGSGICVHGRIRPRCKVYVGYKYHCIECCSRMCEHSKRESEDGCNACDSSVCGHGMAKHLCEVCPLFIKDTCTPCLIRLREEVAKGLWKESYE